MERNEVMGCSWHPVVRFPAGLWQLAEGEVRHNIFSEARCGRGCHGKWNIEQGIGNVGLGA